MWLPNTSTLNPPSYQFTYRITEGEPVAVGTRTLGNRALQDTSYTLYDGFLRERKASAPARTTAA